MFAPDRSDFGKFSAVGANACISDFSAYFFFGNVIKGILDLTDDVGFGKVQSVETVIIFGGEMFDTFFFDLVLPVLAFKSVKSIKRPVEFFGSVFAHLLVEFFRNVVKFHFSLGLTARFYDFFNESALFFDFFVTE